MSGIRTAANARVLVAPVSAVLPTETDVFDAGGDIEALTEAIEALGYFRYCCVSDDGITITRDGEQEDVRCLGARGVSRTIRHSEAWTAEFDGRTWGAYATSWASGGDETDVSTPDPVNAAGVRLWVPRIITDAVKTHVILLFEDEGHLFMVVAPNVETGTSFEFNVVETEAMTTPVSLSLLAPSEESGGIAPMCLYTTHPTFDPAAPVTC